MNDEDKYHHGRVVEVGESHGLPTVRVEWDGPYPDPRTTWWMASPHDWRVPPNEGDRVRTALGYNDQFVMPAAPAPTATTRAMALERLAPLTDAQLAAYVAKRICADVAEGALDYDPDERVELRGMIGTLDWTRDELLGDINARFGFDDGLELHELDKLIDDIEAAAAGLLPAPGQRLPDHVLHTIVVDLPDALGSNGTGDVADLYEGLARHRLWLQLVETEGPGGNPCCRVRGLVKDLRAWLIAEHLGTPAMPADALADAEFMLWGDPVDETGGEAK
jgi:hypothetical protein